MTALREPREFTGRHMLLAIVAFFGVIVTVNVGMAVVASTSWTGLVVRNSYVAGQEFEAKRLAHEAQLAAGWTSRLSFAAGHAVLSVRDKAGDAVGLDHVRLEVNRPVGGHDDQSIVLERREDGTYTAPLALERGVWEARVVAGSELGAFELHKRFRADGSGE